MDIVEINSLHVQTEVGFSPHEFGKLQEFVITIHIKTSKKAGNTDCVQDSVDLKNVTKDVLFQIENKKYNLIEAVATDVARICVVRHGVPWVRVMVKKLNALRFSEYSAVTIERSLEDFEWSDVHVSIGSNIDPYQNIPKALALLKKKVKLVRLSRAFRTTPVGFKEQDDFVNMAVLLKTNLDPEGLKLFLTDIERQLMRIRDAGNPSGPRTIDLDISFWSNFVLDYNMEGDSKTKSYSIPDPDTLKHAHVIVPLADVTPDFIHPMKNKSLKVIATELTGVCDFVSFFPTVQVTETVKGKDDLEESSLAQQNGDPTNSFNKYEDVRSLETPGHPVALITGGAKRLGAAIASQLHTAGYNIIIHYNTSKDQASAIYDELNSIRADSARMIQADLTLDIQNTAERIIRECFGIWGRLDVLVNNAAQFFPTEVGTVTEKNWNDLIQTNLCAPFFLAQAAFPSLKSSRGCIINLLDVHANRPLAIHSVYCISKAGLHMCTLTLAKEFAPHVRVNGVAPGAILWKENEEDFSKDVNELRHKEIIQKIPQGRTGDPRDIASVVEFLACKAGYITGQVISVDGGRTLNQ